jgi:hypothetical protein
MRRTEGSPVHFEILTLRWSEANEVYSQLLQKDDTNAVCWSPTIFDEPGRDEEKSCRSGLARAVSSRNCSAQ